MISELYLFWAISVLLSACFIFYGMDLRRKKDSRNLSPVVLQVLMRSCSLGLILGYVVMAMNVTSVGFPEWLGLALLLFGVTFVAMAKRALGRAHTFTGQCLARPSLVTNGVYSVTRNPLYVGVFH